LWYRPIGKQSLSTPIQPFAAQGVMATMEASWKPLPDTPSSWNMGSMAACSSVRQTPFIPK